MPQHDPVTWEDILETGRIVFGINYERDQRRSDSRIIEFPAGGRVPRLQEAYPMDGDTERQAYADE